MANVEIKHYHISRTENLINMSQVIYPDWFSKNQSVQAGNLKLLGKMLKKNMVIFNLLMKKRMKTLFKQFML